MITEWKCNRCGLIDEDEVNTHGRELLCNDCLEGVLATEYTEIPCGIPDGELLDENGMMGNY